MWKEKRIKKWDISVKDACMTMETLTQTMIGPRLFLWAGRDSNVEPLHSQAVRRNIKNCDGEGNARFFRRSGGASIGSQLRVFLFRFVFRFFSCPFLFGRSLRSWVNSGERCWTEIFTMRAGWKEMPPNLFCFVAAVR